MADKEKGGLPSVDNMLPGRPTNFYGVESEDADKYVQTQRDLVSALEARYSQPNYFKIAAGFAKPQLGGFLASLGSASDAYGEQLENQRAMQIPIYKARSELAAYEIASKQGKKAADIAKASTASGTTPTPQTISDVAGYMGGPLEAVKTGFDAAATVANNMRADLEQGMSYVQLAAKYPDNLLKLLPTLMNKYPELKLPTDTPQNIIEQIKPNQPTPITSMTNPSAPPSAKPSEGNAPSSSSKKVEGVDTSGRTYEQTNAAERAEDAFRIARRAELNKNLGTASTNSVPIYEAGINLYKSASNPLLAPIFALGEKGDPSSIITKALETQSLSSMLGAMREQIISAKLGSQEEKNKALTQFGVFEKSLQDFIVRLQNGYQNPTDMRTAIESSSVPGLKNTQDSFLRIISRISSDHLSNAELNNAWNMYLERGGLSDKWEDSREYRDVMKNRSNRSAQLLSNAARQDLPKFMSAGLSGMYKPKLESDSEKKPSGGAGKSFAEQIKEEKRRRAALKDKE